MGIAAVFPGQGSHAPDMADGLRGHPLVQRGLELLGRDPFAALDAGTAEQQPAIFLCSVAAWEEASPAGVRAAAGHSLGELSALVAAQAIGFEDGLALVDARAAAMARAAAAAPGGMVALLGATPEHARGLAEGCGLVVANDNAPGQVVLAGRSGALEALEDAARDGGLRARRLPVAGAFHSPLMAPAAAAFEEALRRTRVRAARFPVWSGASAAPMRDVRAELAAALLAPVRWRETVLALRAAGCGELVEVGPGRVLTGLVRRIEREAQEAAA